MVGRGIREVVGRCRPCSCCERVGRSGGPCLDQWIWRSGRSEQSHGGLLANRMEDCWDSFTSLAMHLSYSMRAKLSLSFLKIHFRISEPGDDGRKATTRRTGVGAAAYACMHACVRADDRTGACCTQRTRSLARSWQSLLPDHPGAC